MPITRTPMVDDDGSGTTGTIFNNAWKQELYNQIDSLAGGPIVSFPIVDSSGAGLGTLGSGSYIELASHLVFMLAQAVYPSTANGAVASIQLPFVCGTPHAGFFQAYGAHHLWWLQPGFSILRPMLPSTSVQATNAQMSGSNNVLVGFYVKA